MAMKYFAIFCLIGLSLALPKPYYAVQVNVIENISQMKLIS